MSSERRQRSDGDGRRRGPTPPAVLPATPLPATPLLELRGIRAAYGAVEVLHGIDMAVPGGAIVAVLGANGAGKTTALRVMSGLVRPTGGHVLLEGHDVTGVAPERLVRAGVCLVPEGRAIFPNLTVRENVLMDTYVGGHSLAELEQLTYERFPRLGARRHQMAGTLSGGEQQMLALGRAVSTDPALILLDELSMGLAPLIVEQLFATVRQLADTGVTTVIVEQFADVVLGFADHVVVMAQGRVRASGAPDTVRSALAAAYLGGGAA